MPLLIHSLVQLLCAGVSVNIKERQGGKDSYFMAVWYDVMVSFADVRNIFLKKSECYQTDEQAHIYTTEKCFRATVQLC